ncbi:MAG: hypothetical protein J6U72_02155 [Clostridia bacterium]|nr:hypothetical protein [Clostridia bacterium]
MAMDDHKEQIVVKRHNGVNTVIYYLVWIFIVIFGFMGLIEVYGSINTIAMGQFQWPSLVIGLLLVGCAVLLWFKKDTLRVEYEYAFTRLGPKATLDVSQVLNNSKRKYLAEIPLDMVESAGSVNHPSFQRYLSGRDIKRHNWFLNRDADLTYLYFVKNGVKHLAIIEPSPDIKTLITTRNALNFGVWQGEKPA